jgi:hypothetical protein
MRSVVFYVEFEQRVSPIEQVKSLINEASSSAGCSIFDVTWELYHDVVIVRACSP